MLYKKSYGYDITIILAIRYDHYIFNTDTIK